MWPNVTTLGHIFLTTLGAAHENETKRNGVSGRYPSGTFAREFAMTLAEALKAAIEMKGEIERRHHVTIDVKPHPHSPGLLGVASANPPDDLLGQGFTLSVEDFTEPGIGSESQAYMRMSRVAENVSKGLGRQSGLIFPPPEA